MSNPPNQLRIEDRYEVGEPFNCLGTCPVCGVPTLCGLRRIGGKRWKRMCRPCWGRAQTFVRMGLLMVPPHPGA